MSLYALRAAREPVKTAGRFLSQMVYGGPYGGPAAARLALGLKIPETLLARADEVIQ